MCTGHAQLLDLVQTVDKTMSEFGLDTFYEVSAWKCNLFFFFQQFNSINNGVTCKNIESAEMTHSHLCPPPCEIYSVPSTEAILPRESRLVRRGLDWKDKHVRSGAPGTETSPLSPFANIAAPPCF